MAVLCIVRYWVISAASIKDYLAFGCNAGESHWLRIYLYLGDTSQQEWNMQSIFIWNIFPTSLYTIHLPLSEFYSIFFFNQIKIVKQRSGYPVFSITTSQPISPLLRFGGTSWEPLTPQECGNTEQSSGGTWHQPHKFHILGKSELALSYFRFLKNSKY